MVDAEAVTADALRPPDDTEYLVNGLQSADPGAHAELCDRFGSRIHRFAASRLRGDAHLAEDIVVLTFVDAVRRINTFDPKRSTFSAWLYGLARRHTIAELRLQSRRKSIPAAAEVPIDSLDEQTAGGDLAADIADRIQAQQQVSELRTHLADAEMEILILHYAHHLSVIEIGQVMGRSERAVNSLLHRSRQKAREILANREASDSFKRLTSRTRSPKGGE